MSQTVTKISFESIKLIAVWQKNKVKTILEFIDGHSYLRCWDIESVEGRVIKKKRNRQRNIYQRRDGKGEVKDRVKERERKNELSCASCPLNCQTKRSCETLPCKLINEIN